MRWPIGWRRMASFSISRIRIGSAVTAHAMPMPTTNCQAIARGPIQPSCSSIRPAVRQPKASGVPSASPAVMLLSRRCTQACLRSSSTPAIITNNITAHQAIPFSDCTTAGLKTKA
jgi:hypothetical protein